MIALIKPKSLKKFLLGSLLGSISAALIVAVVVTYFKTENEIGEMFDAELISQSQMLNAMGALAGDLPKGTIIDTQQFITQVDIGSHDDDDDDDSSEDRITFAVLNQRGELLLSSNNFPTGALEFFVQHYEMSSFSTAQIMDVLVENVIWRGLISHYANEDQQWLLVLQNDSHRTKVAAELALQAVWPVLALIPLIAIMVIFVVRLLLQGVHQLQMTLKNRSEKDLTALPTEDVIEEIQPFVGEINALMKHIEKLIVREKQFVSDAAHEMKTPLAILKIHAENLQAATTEVERKLSTEKLIKGIDRTSHLTSQLLMLAKVEDKNEETVSSKSFSLNRLCETIIGDIYPLALKKKQEIGLDADVDISMTGDKELIRVMLDNIINNALRYSPENGSVNVVLAKKQGRIKIEIQDDGKGIAKDKASLLMERFARGETGKGDGTGLGLAIVQRIVDLHGGSIGFRAAEQGKQACCWLIF